MTELNRLRACGIRTPHRGPDVSPSGLAPVLPVRLRPLTEEGHGHRGARLSVSGRNVEP
jgi:hypothetical protein